MAGNLKRGHAPGEKHPNARLTDDQVTDIRARVTAGELQKNLALEFGVSAATISKVCSGRSRPHLPLTAARPKRKGGEHPRARLTEVQATRIWERLQQGEGVRPLAREYGVSPSLIHRIKRGTAWKHIKPAMRRKRVWEQ